MNTAIQPLPNDLVHLIAAGEVIDSLAAVVRELVENSLDAGATRIAVTVWPHQWRVQVADNGMGMGLVNLQQAASAHSTSKIRSCDDLWKITSLGFRGEALHSIAALADLEIWSRQQGTTEGWRIRYTTRGKLHEVVTAAIAPGTVVNAANIFGHCPVRRQGLPSVSQQLRTIQILLGQFALCHPHVTWQVQQNERPWFTISPGKSTRQILPQLLRQVRQNDLQNVTLKVASPTTDNLLTPNAKIQLVLGLPDRCHRRRPDWVRVATNGRVVRSPALEQTILAAMARTLPRDRFPICFVHLQICPNQIDWNRHPAKAEIYLHNLEYWQEQVSHAIEQALRITPDTLPEAVHSQRVGQLLKVSEQKASYHLNRSITPQSQTSSTANKTEEFGLVELQAIAQVRNTYILAEHPTGMWLIEQHIAHERVIYEQLCDHWQLVALETPVILNDLTSAQLEQLQRLGLEVEPFGDRIWAVRNAPAILAKRDDAGDALLELSLGGDLQTAQVATACRSAIRNGTPLTLSEMQTLLDHWKTTRNPRTCPHGRPIYLSLEESALARFFRRHWVIGKSHGI